MHGSPVTLAQLKAGEYAVANVNYGKKAPAFVIVRVEEKFKSDVDVQVYDMEPSTEVFRPLYTDRSHGHFRLQPERGFRLYRAIVTRMGLQPLKTKNMTLHPRGTEQKLRKEKSQQLNEQMEGSSPKAEDRLKGKTYPAWVQKMILQVSKEAVREGVEKPKQLTEAFRKSYLDKLCLQMGWEKSDFGMKSTKDLSASLKGEMKKATDAIVSRASTGD
ncbi:hypothetical protein FOZ63_025017 [Perkinsus olseni]|uniref:Uncharacterized protein n=2 Tax=Perkinsus olseni TaxID=32597 RepID=A0A7J6TAN0_PEROL|nr:hypothetical protein FOZ62_023023 [Perkinsus olseni]KAF4742329.1 hypothetical protein FOZ63_025017 [Perkinsus olseni]